MDKIDSVFAYILTKYSEHPKQSHMTPFEHFYITMKLFGLSLITSFAFFFHAVCPWLLIDTGNYLTNILFNHTKSYHSNNHKDLNENNENEENVEENVDESDEENKNNNMEDDVDLDDNGNDDDEENKDDDEENDDNNVEDKGSDYNEEKKEKED